MYSLESTYSMYNLCWFVAQELNLLDRMFLDISVKKLNLKFLELGINDYPCVL